ncbi:MAG TPA: amidohydrolase [Jatrophihabitantaceae bacterium]|nr:amidohydrolase [Jatrophihabitantaceae bacterium]
MTDVVALRRDLHAHPELAFAEHRTTEVIVGHLAGLGLRPRVLPSGTGVVCDVGEASPVVGLRADIDALPIADLKDVPYRSSVDGVCHGCGHDAHTAILLAVASELVAAPPAHGSVRLLFQPAEETVPGGAVSVIEAGVLDGVRQIFALHCDPRLDTGSIGVRVGAITAACDYLDVTLRSPGGHTARPHLTTDLVYAAGLLITELPALLSRRVDPRAALSLVWGTVDAGRAANAIPTSGRVRGTVRVLDLDSWGAAEPLICELVPQILAPTGVHAEVSYVRGLPPVINDATAVAVQSAAVTSALGAEALTQTQQSMGGEDFAWYVQSIPGALARLGVRRPGAAALDLHQGMFDIDEDALDVGVRYTVALAHAALRR